MRSAFCSGLERDAEKTVVVSTESLPLYALTAMIGVLAFFPFVLLM